MIPIFLDDSLTDRVGNGQTDSFIFPDDNVGLHFNRPSKAEQRKLLLFRKIIFS